MSHIRNLAKVAAAAAALIVAATASYAASSPIGVWYDETGRGAVEIADCGGNLCGKVVWIKDADNDKACGMRNYSAASGRPAARYGRAAGSTIPTASASSTSS